jgi:hypothetical protein
MRVPCPWKAQAASRRQRISCPKSTSFRLWEFERLKQKTQYEESLLAGGKGFEPLLADPEAFSFLKNVLFVSNISTFS